MAKQPEPPAVLAAPEIAAEREKALLQAIARLDNPPFAVDAAGRALKIGQRQEIRTRCLEVAAQHKWGAYYPGGSFTEIAEHLFDWVMEQGEFAPKTYEGQSEATPAAR